MELGRTGGLAQGIPPGQGSATRGHRGRRAGAGLVLGLLAVAAFAGLRLRDAGLAGLPAFLGLVVPGGAAALGWWAAMRASAAARRTWLALAAGLTLWLGAAFYDLPWTRQGTGEPPAHSLCAGAANLFWLYALVCLSRTTPIVPRIAAILEVGLIWLCGITLAAYFIIEPGSRDLDGSLLSAKGPATLLLFAHVVSTLLLFGALVGFRYLATGALSRVQVLLLLGVFAALVGDGWQLHAAAAGHAPPELVLTAIRVVPALLFGAAAFRTIRPPAAGKHSNRWENLAPWLPLACLAAVITLPLLAYTGGRPLDMQLALAVFACLALAVLRLGFSLGENHQLRQERARLLWQNQEYIRLAISDPLTGLFNMGYFQYRLKIEFERDRHEGYALTLIALDLDNFKQVNDRFGHAAGDTLLKDIGQVLRGGIRSADMAYRCGGDEFVLILPHTTAEQGAILAERLRAGIEQVVARRGVGALVSASAGVASYPQDTPSLEGLPRLTDLALYQSKQQGKNRTSIYTPPL